MQESSSSPTASAIQPGCASVRWSRTSPRPGASSATSTSTPISSATRIACLSSVRGSNSLGSALRSEALRGGVRVGPPGAEVATCGDGGGGLTT